MDTSKIVGEKIKSLRESQSISIEQLAERSGLAVEQIERIENNIALTIRMKRVRPSAARRKPKTVSASPIMLSRAVSTWNIIPCPRRKRTGTWSRLSSM